jgi:hypothetical protein
MPYKNPVRKDERVSLHATAAPYAFANIRCQLFKL